MKSAIVVAILVASSGCAKGDPREKPLEIMPEMVESVPYDAFSPSPITRDKKTLMAPAKGTLPRGFTPLHYGKGPEEAERAGRELQNPLAATPENLARGEKLYRSFCVPCHGAGGLGDGPIIPKFPAPPPLNAARAKGLPDGRVHHIIARGQGLMPAHAAQIGYDDRWRIVLHVRSLQKGGAP